MTVIWSITTNPPIASLQLLSNRSRAPSSPPSSKLRPPRLLPIHTHYSSSFSCLISRVTDSFLIANYVLLIDFKVRHAQGVHNVEAEKDEKAFLSPSLFDAPLTPLGWQQVDNLREHVHASGLLKRIELVIASPLLRTLQTAVGVFGGEGYVDGMNVLPLMVANAGNSGRSAYSSSNCPPFIAVELCREHLGVRPCDSRRSISEYGPLFPAIDFSLIEDDEDFGGRLMLWTREEKEIAVVTHSGFLFHTLKEYGKGCHPMMKEEICKHFANCELRSMVLVDRNMVGKDPPVTNYPGKIPAGSDLPSDTAHKKLNEKTI
ncbi:hypothetical protein Syun_004386 [Stephania yunnanensis]|uniref:Phosphoglycerate mutase-like protein 1 n=1 Tax=Stephania yunnanensis TaxID=152371 RepID=A0AAP0L735_9MAGN